MFPLPFQLTFTLREYTFIIILEVIECCIMFLYAEHDTDKFKIEMSIAPGVKDSSRINESFMNSAVWTCVMVDMIIILAQFNARFAIDETSPLIYRGFYMLVHYCMIITIVYDLYCLSQLSRLKRHSVTVAAEYMDIINDCVSDEPKYEYTDEEKEVTKEFIVMFIENLRKIRMVYIILVFDIMYLIIEWLMYGYIL